MCGQSVTMKRRFSKSKDEEPSRSPLFPGSLRYLVRAGVTGRRLMSSVARFISSLTECSPPGVVTCSRGDSRTRLLGPLRGRSTVDIRAFL